MLEKKAQLQRGSTHIHRYQNCTPWRQWDCPCNRVPRTEGKGWYSSDSCSVPRPHSTALNTRTRQSTPWILRLLARLRGAVWDTCSWVVPGTGSQICGVRSAIGGIKWNGFNRVNINERVIIVNTNEDVHSSCRILRSNTWDNFRWL